MLICKDLCFYNVEVHTNYLLDVRLGHWACVVPACSKYSSIFLTIRDTMLDPGVVLELLTNSGTAAHCAGAALVYIALSILMTAIISYSDPLTVEL